jgi:hypothetical protein
VENRISNRFTRLLTVTRTRRDDADRVSAAGRPPMQDPEQPTDIPAEMPSGCCPYNGIPGSWDGNTRHGAPLGGDEY